MVISPRITIYTDAKLVFTFLVLKTIPYSIRRAVCLVIAGNEHGIAAWYKTKQIVKYKLAVAHIKEIYA